MRASRAPRSERRGSRSGGGGDSRQQWVPRSSPPGEVVAIANFSSVDSETLGNHPARRSQDHRLQGEGPPIMSNVVPAEFAETVGNRPAQRRGRVSPILRDPLPSEVADGIGNISLLDSDVIGNRSPRSPRWRRPQRFGRRGGASSILGDPRPADVAVIDNFSLSTSETLGNQPGTRSGQYRRRLGVRSTPSNSLPDEVIAAPNLSPFNSETQRNQPAQRDQDGRQIEVEVTASLGSETSANEPAHHGKSSQGGGAPSISTFPASFIPQLVQEIQEKLVRGMAECMICYENVQRSSTVWSCGSCFSIFHLHCIKKWAKSPTSADLSSEASSGLNWRCPGCQFVYITPAKDLHYTCFCSKRRDPPEDPYLIPHSCGEPCGKPLGRSLSATDAALRCPHSCVLQCHPGPCPPCKNFAPPRQCPCGKQTLVRRCSDQSSPLTCGGTCDKLLLCGRHHCTRPCHVGTCDPCCFPITASCFCQRLTVSVLCGEIAVSGSFDQVRGVFSCDSICDKTLHCGNHSCLEACHPGPCGDCGLDPSKVKTCPCGKMEISKPRASCLDPIPTCEKTCGKYLRCGIHTCEAACHAGDCPPCNAPAKQNCRCGSNSREVECFKITNWEAFLCEKPCGKKKTCGRHRCSERCCPPNSSHVCPIMCGKKLRCGQHACESLCHSGHCPPCLETIFAELSCACGKTVIPPPQPCGTPYPSCQHLCQVPQPCGHQATHTCHFGDCPPCSVPSHKECVGGHVILRNVPCGSRDIRCNQLCGKTRKCGIHACARTCHPPPCDSSSASFSCGQVCGAPRRDCRHSCARPCHPGSPCPEERCEFSVTVACACGRITATAPCWGGERKLGCDEECSKVERKRMLAEAFDVAPLNPSIPEVISELYRREPKWVAAVEERLRALVTGKSSLSAVKVHVFCAMPKEKRDAVRAMAERWKLAVHAAGWEPRRFLTVRVTQKSRPPAMIMGPRAGVAAPVLDLGFDMDPRLVVALYEMPDDGDINALVLRFGGECELVWLDKRNALAVFADPARAATALRRLDRGLPYRSAAVVMSRAGGSRAEASVLGKKVAIAAGKEVSTWAAGGPTIAAWPAEGPAAPAPVAVNRWSVLDSNSATASSVAESVADDWENLVD